jgi:N4-gp56 family major capsid protein
MATQTIAVLTAENKTFYDRALLKRLLPMLVWQKYGQKRPIPKKEGDKINFRKFNSLTAATTALTEGTTPGGNSLNITKIEATVKQYGDFIELSDKLDMVGIDSNVAETSDLLGEQAGLTLDTLVRDVVSAGTNVQYAGGKTSTADLTATDKITYEEVKKAVRTLKKANAKSYENKYFIGVVDSSVAYDLMSDTMWTDISKYNGGVAIMDGEIGKLAGVRFIETENTLLKAGAASAPVHCSMIIGADSYGVVDVAGSGKPSVIVKSLGSAGTTDPLDQRSSVGWKSMFTTVRLEELAMLRIESGVTE